MELINKLKKDSHVLLSVVIATYNVAGFIEDTLDSVLENLSKKNLSKIEVIINDDCSTDNTRDVILNYFTSKEDIQILFYQNKKNMGTSGTSFNFGIDNARGKYIHFLDGDDLVNSKIYLDFLEANVKENVDVFSYEMITFNKKVHQIVSLDNFPQTFVDEYPYQRTEDTFKKRIQSFSCSTKIFKAHCIQQLNLRFNPSSFYQDKDFILSLYEFSPRIEYVTKAFYFYRCGIASNSTTINFDKFKEQNVLNKRLQNIFPEMVQDEQNYLVKILLNINIESTQEIMDFFIQNEICSNFIFPETRNLFEWYNYFLQLSLSLQDKVLLETVINSFSQLKYILDEYDYKVIPYSSNSELNKIILLDLLRKIKYLSTGEQLITCFDDKLIKLFELINLREPFTVLSHESKQRYFNFLCCLLQDFSEEELQLVLSHGKFPLFLKEKAGLKDFLYTYIENMNEAAEIKYSTIMVSYNREDFIGEAIDSFIANHYSKSELIIVDNGSNVKTIEFIENKIKDIENITLVKLSKNYYGGARNYGIEKANGTYVSFFDDDDKISSIYYQTLDKYLIDDTIDALRFNMRWVDSRNDSIAKLYYSNVTVYRDDKKVISKHSSQYLSSLRSPLSSTALCVVHKRLISSNAFIKNIAYEDIILFNEIALTANRISFITDVLYERKEHASSLMAQEKEMTSEKRFFYLQSNYTAYFCNFLNIISVGEDINDYREGILFYYTSGANRIDNKKQGILGTKGKNSLEQIIGQTIQELIQNDNIIDETIKESLYIKYCQYRNYKGDME